MLPTFEPMPKICRWTVELLQSSRIGLWITRLQWI